MYDLPQENDLNEEGSLTTQQIDALEEKNKLKRRLLVIGLLIFAAIFYFVWQNVLNFGYVKIYGKVPYDVMIFEEKNQECTENPCVIKLKRGEKSLLFHKIGYEADAANIEVALWDTITVKANFELVPYMREITPTATTAEASAKTPEAPPAAPSYSEYELKYDKIHHNWMLVEKGDKKERALTYFPEKLTSPLIFGSDSSVLIVEKQVYFVDLNSKQTFAIGTLDELGTSNGKIVDVKPSINGQYFLLLLENDKKESSLALADKYKIWTLAVPAAASAATVPTDFSNMYWTLRTQIAMTYKKDSDWIFSVYKPEIMAETILIETDKFTDETPVTNFFPSMKTSSLFFTAGEISYEIIY
ncbi:MAG: hypothetical protein WC604_04075 [Candidatus Gracilibacteria bacterium]